MQLEILYEDNHCLVINKPAGLDVNDLPYEFLAHRIDKDTTGCLLIAKSKEDQEFLQRQFKERTVNKTYLVLVAGIPNIKEAIIDSPIGRSLVQKIKMSIVNVGKGRDAQTKYKVISSSSHPSLLRGGEYSLLECKPYTGRTHQIRVHLQSIGHPILGDQTYHSRGSRGLSKELGIESLCLHAWKISFESPDGMRVNIEAPAPGIFNF